MSDEEATTKPEEGQDPLSDLGFNLTQEDKDEINRAVRGYFESIIEEGEAVKEGVAAFLRVDKSYLYEEGGDDE